jgi:hypothetical protein
MPTKREREYYRMGFSDGMRAGQGRTEYGIEASERAILSRRSVDESNPFVFSTRSKPKRKLSAWNKYVKANSKKPRFRYRNGKLNLKKMAIAFRKTPAGRKKRR